MSDLHVRAVLEQTDAAGPIVRFAPSPTGRLHVGNARIALCNWLLARPEGRFLLRSDDTDTDRNIPGALEQIQEDLRWLGLDWDEFFAQSDRQSRYEEVRQDLQDRGLLYPCYETPEELAVMRNLALAQHKPPRYDGRARDLTEPQRRALEREGRRPYWRLRLPQGSVTWSDGVSGDVSVNFAALSDPVLIRADGRMLYTFTSVVDDRDMKVNTIVRGADHITNTAVQCALWVMLDNNERGGRAGVPVRFAHLPLLLAGDGGELSKRTGGALSLGDLRESGIEPEPLVTYLTLLGTDHMVRDALSVRDIGGLFDLGHFGRSGPRFDPATLAMLNERWIRSPAGTERRETFAQSHQIPVSFVKAVSDNLTALSDLLLWWRLCSADDVIPSIEKQGQKAFALLDVRVLEQAAACLPDDPWSEDTMGRWVRAISSATGIKGKPLFLSLRLGLTGRPDGPELKRLLPFIGRERSDKRLRALADALAKDQHYLAD